jgi:metallophosphoesterase (TIGR03767 family)
VGGAGAALALPSAVRPAFAAQGPARAAAELTTLAQTLRPGPAGDLGYRRIVSGPGEPHVVRDALAKAKSGRASRRRSLLSFVHLTDQHIVDVQSPTRVEFLDRYADNECEPIPFSSAFRPQEAASARIADAMNRRLRKIGVSPVTGAPVAAAVCTGDNTDNQQINELDWFLSVMDGGRLQPNSGDPTKYEGVQASGDLTYWHPDPGVNDFYKQRHGFPSREGYLADALAAFKAVGVGVPWYTCYGNHDGLAQGNAPVNPAFDRLGVGGTKVIGAPAGANPCEHFGGLDQIPAGAVVQPTTPDAKRAYISRRQWIARHLESTGKPVGHGFTAANVDNNLAYYASDVGPLRFITLDTVNPGGLDSGSIGEAQLQWLEAQLAEAQQQRKLVILFSHHGLRSLDNPNEAPDPLNPADSDLPRRRADEVLARIAEFTCIIAWVNGHTHSNVIQPQSTFWDIGTAAHIDWPAQARLIDVVDNRDGTLSIFTTLFDHDDDPVASFARELGGNDPQKGFGAGSGKVEDRNAELLLPHPFAGSGSGRGGEGADTAVAPARGRDGAAGAPRTLPATGGASAAQLGAAAAVAAGAQLLRSRTGEA